MNTSTDRKVEARVAFDIDAAEPALYWHPPSMQAVKPADLDEWDGADLIPLYSAEQMGHALDVIRELEAEKRRIVAQFGEAVAEDLRTGKLRLDPSTNG